MCRFRTTDGTKTLDFRISYGVSEPHVITLLLNASTSKHTKLSPLLLQSLRHDDVLCLFGYIHSAGVWENHLSSYIALSCLMFL